MDEEGVRLRFIGRRDRIAPQVAEEIEWAEQLTARHTARTRVRRLRLRRPGRDPRTPPSATRAAGRTSSAATSTRPSCEDPELIIRTGGELRLSNFLLWQAAYCGALLLGRAVARLRPRRVRAGARRVRARASTASEADERRRRSAGGAPAPAPRQLDRGARRRRGAMGGVRDRDHPLRRHRLRGRARRASGFVCAARALPDAARRCARSRSPASRARPA